MQLPNYGKYIPRGLSTYCMYKSTYTVLQNGIILTAMLIKLKPKNLSETIKVTLAVRVE